MAVASYEALVVFVSDSQLTRFCVEGFENVDPDYLLDSKGTQNPGGGWDTPLQEANRDVPLDGVAFSPLE